MRRSEKLPGRFSAFLRGLVAVYFEKQIGRSAAALAFYLSLSVFPFLICVLAMLNPLRGAGDFLVFLEGLLPQNALELLRRYLFYLWTMDQSLVLTAGLALVVTSSSAAFRVILSAMRDIQGRARFSGVLAAAASFLFSVVFLAVIYAALLMILGGEWLISRLAAFLDVGVLPILWKWLRFVALFVLLYGLLLGIYIATAPKEGPRVRRSPGALTAAFVLAAMSVLFSWFVGFSVRYTVVYGSLATVFLLMVWLNLCGNVIIMGNAVNTVAALERRTARGGPSGGEKVQNGSGQSDPPVLQ